MPSSFRMQRSALRPPLIRRIILRIGGV
jgi:hypothetical protein